MLSTSSPLSPQESPVLPLDDGNCNVWTFTSVGFNVVWESAFSDAADTCFWSPSTALVSGNTSTAAPKSFSGAWMSTPLVKVGVLCRIRFCSTCRRPRQAPARRRRDWPFYMKQLYGEYPVGHSLPICYQKKLVPIVNGLYAGTSRMCLHLLTPITALPTPDSTAHSSYTQAC